MTKVIPSESNQVRLSRMGEMVRCGMDKVVLHFLLVNHTNSNILIRGVTMVPQDSRGSLVP